MSNRDIDLERRLSDLAEHLDAPDAPELRERVLMSIRDLPAPRLARPRLPLARRKVAIAIAAVLAAIGAVAAAPAVADWLGIRGVEIHREQPPVRPPASTTSAPPSDPFGLGRQVTEREAARLAGFALLRPTVLGQPDSTWVDVSASVPIVSFRFGDDVLVSEFEATIGGDNIIQKFANGQARLERLSIGGKPAIWIEGTHQVAVIARGEVVADRLRSSDSALLVEHGNLTVRIETSQGRDAAIRIAASLR